MGYNLGIGEAVVDWNAEWVGVEARYERLDSAPAFGDPSDHINYRYPSYSVWAEFCRIMGIEELFPPDRSEAGCDEDALQPLISEHPGCEPILPEHLELIESRLADYKARHPTHIARFTPDGAAQNPDHDGSLCRMEWLVFWIRWALNNCDKPVFFNS